MRQATLQTLHVSNNNLVMDDPTMWMMVSHCRKRQKACVKCYYPHKMNHGVSEKHKIHAGASDTLIILLQVHLESFFKAFEGWNLKD